MREVMERQTCTYLSCQLEPSKCLFVVAKQCCNIATLRSSFTLFLLPIEALYVVHIGIVLSPFGRILLGNALMQVALDLMPVP